MPLGTRGGMKFTHTFPADGEYRITLTDLGVGLYPRAVETRHTLVVLVDRNEQFRGDIGGEEDLALIDTRRRAGARRAHEALRRHSAARSRPARTRSSSRSSSARARRATSRSRRSRRRGDFSFGGAARVPGIVGGINMVGPFNSTGLTRTREPPQAVRLRARGRASASASAPSEIATNLARRAFRRPVEPSRSRPPHAVLRGRPQGRRRLRRRHRAHDDRRAREPRFPLSLDCAARRDASAASHELERIRARLAALLLLMEPRPRRRAARARGVGRARAARACSTRKSSACSPTRAPRCS